MSGWNRKYKPALSKLDSSYGSLFCATLTTASLAVNDGRSQFAASGNNLFSYVVKIFARFYYCGM